MENKIRIGIVGYGNLGKGAELAVNNHRDMELIAIFTRRNPEDLGQKSIFVSYDKILDYKNKIDVMILCGGSAKDLDIQSLEVNKYFNTVDSFDNHSRIPEYFNKVNESNIKNNTLSLISIGWDPGLFSLNRLIADSILPQGESYTFWGEGLSQGHSEAIRRIEGVKAAVQYTIPLEEELNNVRKGLKITSSQTDRHRRVCYVAVDENASKDKIEKEIINMPNYFLGYDTSVYFVDEEEIRKKHYKMKHGGYVIHSGKSSKDNNQTYEFNLKLDSNPEFTSSVLVAYARAIYRLSNEGKTGAVTIFDIPPIYISSKSAEDLRRSML